MMTEKTEHLGSSESLGLFQPDEAMSDAPSAPSTPKTRTTASPRSSRSTSSQTEQSSGSATTAPSKEAGRLTAAHRKALKEKRGLNPDLCEQLGVWSSGNAIAFDYRVGGNVHNTKLRRGKGNMPWSEQGKDLVLWNVDCLRDDPAPDEEVIITEGEFDAVAFIQAGYRRVVSIPNGAQTTEKGFAYLFRGDTLHPDLQKFGRYVIATDGDGKGRECRDALAVHLGDERCRSVCYPDGAKDANDTLLKGGITAVTALIENARPMYTDEVARMSDIPEPPSDEPRYRFGISGLDNEGLRITLPAFMPVIGPYGSGKSVLLRQLVCCLYKLHGWRCLMTVLEERAKPRVRRDLRRHFIGRSMLPDKPWTAEEIREADEQIEDGFVFLQRARGKTLDQTRLIDRIEFAVRVYGVRVIVIDPANEIKLTPEKGQLKTDLMGDWIMQLKELAIDHNLLMIVAAHPSVEKTERKLRSGKGTTLLTLNDGEDTRHWGTKADIGWCVWRDLQGPTMLHVDKVKDEESMGRRNLFELELDRALAQYTVARSGYDTILGSTKGKG